MGFRRQVPGRACGRAGFISGLRDCLHHLVRAGLTSIGARTRIVGTVLLNLHSRLRLLRHCVERSLVRVSIWSRGVARFLGWKRCSHGNDRSWTEKLPIHRESMRHRFCFALGWILLWEKAYAMDGGFDG